MKRKMLEVKSLKIKNFASFNNTGNEIGEFDKLNIFIGKNNQGKSNLLKVIKFLDYNELISFLNAIPDSTKEFDEMRSIGSQRELHSFFHYKSSNFLDAHFKEPIEISYVIEIDKEIHEYEIKIESLVWKNNGIFCYIDEEGIYRESKIPVKTFYDEEEITLNEILGYPNKIVYPISFSAMSYDFEVMKRNLLDLSYQDRREIVENLLKETQELSPDFHKLFLAFEDSVMPRDASGRNYREVQKQIYEEELFLSAELFLEKIGLTFETLGLGQKQTIALFYEMDKAKLDDASIITIDEMELHLYPALQKNILKQIKNRTINNQFFISTHSNIFISMPLNQKIFSIKKIENSTNVELKTTTLELYKILDDLGVKASDILQSNGVIWVEGPSDSIIIQNFLRKNNVPQNDLDQISFVFYGGASIRRIKFEELLNLNRNCVVIQDSDKSYECEQLKEGKLWVKEKCNDLKIHCWTTKRREIENYFSINSIKKFIKNHPRIRFNLPINFNDYSDIETTIRNYSKDKPGYAREIVNYMTKKEIEDDKELLKELNKIKKLIYMWIEY